MYYLKLRPAVFPNGNFAHSSTMIANIVQIFIDMQYLNRDEPSIF